MKYALKLIPNNTGAVIAVQKKKSSKLSAIRERLGYVTKCTKTGTLFVTVDHLRLAYWIGAGLIYPNTYLLRLIHYGSR